MARKLQEGKSNETQVTCTKEAKDALRKWILGKKLPPQQNHVVAGVIFHFLRQEEYVQTAILSAVDDGMELPYADMLDKLEAELRQRATKRRMEGGK